MLRKKYTSVIAALAILIFVSADRRQIKWAASILPESTSKIAGWNSTTGAPAVITLGTNLSMSGTTLNATSSGTVGGSTGSIDNALITANGTGGSTIQSSLGVTLDDNLVFKTTSTKTRIYSIPLGEQSAILSGESTLLSSSDIDDGDAITIQIQWAAKDDNTNTGAGGFYIGTWTKAGGTLQNVFEDDTRKGNDIGTVVTVSTIDIGGTLTARIALAGGGTGNMSVSWFATVIQRKSS